MSKSLTVTALTGIQIVDVVRVEKGWVVSADGPRRASCPSCGTASAARHGSYRRSLHDLPAQGSSVIIDLAITRLKCVNQGCHRRTFSATVAQVAGPGARMTSRMIEIVRLLGHSTGGRTAERLLARLGMPVSDENFPRGQKSLSEVRLLPKSAISPATASGDSSIDKCPVPGSTCITACGMRGSNSARNRMGGSTRSNAPAMTSVGTLMSPTRAAMSSRLVDLGQAALV